jgi:Family of unknown function (DUF5677)
MLTTPEQNQRTGQGIEELRQLCDYCNRQLEDEDITPDELIMRNRYLYGLVILSVAFSDGLVRLAEKGHLRAIIPVLRSLYETWVNAKFIYSSRSHIWVNYLILNGEKERIEKLDHLLADGNIPQDHHDKQVKKANKIINTIKRKYKTLPAIPNVLSRNLEIDHRVLVHMLTLRQRCQIIDYYKPPKKKAPQSSDFMVTNYDWVYGHLSEVTHVEPSALNDLFRKDNLGRWIIDVSGGGDVDYLIRLLNIAFVAQYELLAAFKEYIAKNDKRVSDELQHIFRSKLS